MPVGAVSEVFKDDQQAYHLFRVEDRKTEDGVEKLKIQDIQLRVRPSDSTVGDLSQQAVNLAQEAREKGLAVAAGERDLKVAKTDWVSEGGVARDLAMAPGAVSWAHKSAVGDVSRPFESIQGWHILRVAEKRPAQSLSFEEVRENVRGDCADAKSVEKARAHAERFYARLQAGVPFEVGETTPFARSGSLGRLGRDPLLIGTTFRLPVDALSPLIESPGAVVAMRVLEKVAVSEQDFEGNKGRLAEQLAREKQTLVYNQWMTGLRNGAKIEDFREIESSG
jgi:parvulin-like peptidyl-prolyl isomerase